MQNYYTIPSGFYKGSSLTKYFSIENAALTGDAQGQLNTWPITFILQRFVPKKSMFRYFAKITQATVVIVCKQMSENTLY